jgi:hypothetical protein
MVTMQVRSRHAPYVDQDPTHMDARPWHDRPRVSELDADIPIDVDVEVDAEVAVTTPVAIEALPLPVGLRESMLPRGARPVGSMQVRIALVRLAREVAREYRVAYGCTLRTDAVSIERLQLHLLARSIEVLAGGVDARAMTPEIVRHGVVLGEILRYSLGATWLDLSGDDPGTWELLVYPRAVVCPVARVQQFLLQRSPGPDLATFFRELVR